MKYTEIILTKKDKKNNRKQIDKCLITDFIAVTKYSDPNQSFKVYQEKRKEGKQNVSWTRGVLTEDYPDMKKKDILKLILTQLEEMKTRMGNDMIINWEIKER